MKVPPNRSRIAWFQAFYKTHFQKLKLFCLGMLKDLELAENASAEVLAKLYQQKDFEGIQNVEAWCFTAARNYCLTLLTKTKRRQELRQQLPASDNISTPSVMHDLNQKAMLEKMERILSEQEWLVWKMHLAGYQNQEIADKYELNSKTVANLKSLARNKLKKAFQKA